MKDNVILEKIGQGDETALDYLYQKYYHMMCKMVITNNGSEEEARDIYQEALIVFWQKANSKQLVLTSKISTYLYSICKNLWHKELSRKKRLVHEVKDGIQVVDDDRQERIKIMRECIDELGKTCKDLLSYYYFDELSMKDITVKLGFANADTTKTKKYKCMKKLSEIVHSKYKATELFD